MAEELIIIGRKLDQPIRGDLTPIQGTAVDAYQLDVGNTDTYTPSDGVNYVKLRAVSALWYRISDVGDASNAAVAGNGSVYLGANEIEEVAMDSTKILKAIADA